MDKQKFPDLGHELHTNAYTVGFQFYFSHYNQIPILGKS